MGTLTALLLCLLLVPSDGQECICRAPEKGLSTRPGFSEEITVEEGTPYKVLRGTVQLSGHDVLEEDVLVELFTRSDKAANQHRMAACLTKEDGRFCFANVPKGNYELRLSKDGGFEITHVYVSVEPHNKKSTDAEMRLFIDVGH